MRCELWLLLKQIPLLYDLELELEVKIKVRSDGQIITDAMIMKDFSKQYKR